MRFIRKGGRVIPIRDGGSKSKKEGRVAKGLKAGASAGGQIGAMSGAIEVAGAHGIAGQINRKLWANGGARKTVSIHAPSAAKFVAKRSIKYAAVGAAIGGAVMALRGRKNGKSK